MKIKQWVGVCIILEKEVVVMQVKKCIFQQHGDERGQLVALEENREVPFKIKRVYYIFDTKEAVVRGKHAHKNLQQILICVKGTCKIRLDDGKERITVILNNPSEGLYVSSDIWREMYDFSKDAVLLVLASELYDENDYIRDYEDFLRYVGEK